MQEKMTPALWACKLGVGGGGGVCVAIPEMAMGW